MLMKAPYGHVSPYEASRNKQSAGQDDNEQIILQFLPLVKTMALRLKARLPDQVCAEDLFTAGIMGLMDAIDKFDPEQGTPLGAYAKIRIRGSMLDEIRSMHWVPRSVRQKSAQLENACQSLQARLGRFPTEEEIAAHLGVSLEEYFKLMDEVKGISFLPDEFQLSMTENGESDPQEISHDTPYQHSYREELKAHLAEAISSLTEREQQVIALYYDEELTMKEIGAVLGCTESRVCQIHSKVMLKLRSRLRSRLKQDDVPDHIRFDLTPGKCSRKNRANTSKVKAG